MKFNENEKKINKERGNRLKECRRLRDMTQEGLAKVLFFSTNYISMLERGDRPIEYELAQKIGKELNVNPEYIMCMSDYVELGHSAIKSDAYAARDAMFIIFLEEFHFTFCFYVVKAYSGKQPKKKRYRDEEYIDWNSLEIKASIGELSEICFSDESCYLNDGEAKSEVIIRRVSVNGVILSYGQFVFLINRLYDYIEFTFRHLDDFKQDYDYQIYGMDSVIDQLVKASRVGSMGEAKFRKSLEEIMKDAPEEDITLPDGTIAKATTIPYEAIKRMEN